MKISAKQALEAFQESFVKQTSAPIAELISDDFVYFSSKNETQTKDEMLEWVASFEGRNTLLIEGRSQQGREMSFSRLVLSGFEVTF